MLVLKGMSRLGSLSNSQQLTSDDHVHDDQRSEQSTERDPSHHRGHDVDAAARLWARHVHKEQIQRE